MNQSKKIFSFLVIALLFSLPLTTSAQSVDEIKGKIDDRNNNIAKLEQEIKAYQLEIEALGKEKATLSSTIKQLDLSKKKLETDTKITEAKIAEKNLEIKGLSAQIGDKNERIGDGKRLIAHSLAAISQMGSGSLLEDFLGKESLSEIWSRTDELTTLQKGMQDSISDLETLKSNLESNKRQTETKKAELVELTNDLKNQAKLVAENTKEKNSILAETKNSEANYKKLLATRQAQKEAFEKELLDLESALKIAIDPSSIPTAGAGVLRWPVDKMRKSIITQYFGNTSFATKNPQIYNGGGHGGIDIGVPSGTALKAALSGTILATGNTDTATCRSYGKWIVVKHPNGISTLYAHLSQINVKQGDTVSTGEIIGYSGNTGASTGPHLHFGVYATEGWDIRRNPGSKGCASVVIPYASLNAYLNPLSFLPAL